MINKQEYIDECDAIFKKMNIKSISENMAGVAANMSTNMLVAVINNDVKHPQGIAFGNEWVQVCRKELDNRIDETVFG